MTAWMRRIIDLSVRHKAVVFAAVAVGCVCGYWSIATMQLDAIPDLGDVQVIISSRWDRTPQLVEDQVTYPIVSAMLGAPHVKTVRGVSDFGYSFVYVIFDDNTDLYWARSRTLEYLSSVQAHLPEGVKTEIGPDATSLGWVFQYALVDTSGQHSSSDLRAYQDWYLRNYLKAVPGVADVAPIGGFSKQYQINVDPNRLRRYGLSIAQVVAAVREGNVETSGRLLEFGGTEYMIRGRGYAKSIDDFRDIVVPGTADGSPIHLQDIGDVTVGPDLRRGVADLDGTGDAVSGIVIMRSGENALDVIDRVKAKVKEIEPTLPPGVKLVPVYDRSQLIDRTISSARLTILQVTLTAVLIILVFLWHFPSAVVPLVTMPAAILLAFIPLRLMGVEVNLMSLAGITIAVGELVSASIVVVEQSNKRLEQWQRAGSPGRQSSVVLGAVKEVAAPVVFSMLMIAVSVLPIFALESQEGRMFRPLAYAKCAAMLTAAVLALTFDPALRLLLSHGRRVNFRPPWARSWANALLSGTIHPEEQHPISGRLMRLYEPVVAWALRNRWIVLGTALALILITVPAYFSLGSEFMPPADEGTILYMPTTMPGISVAQAQSLLQTTDKILKQFPEVDRVLGKAGRAETATDPAPLSMAETLITLKPRSQWRSVDTWYTGWTPEWIRPVFRHVTPDTISMEDLIVQMNAALQAPGVSNAWTMPIQGRNEMLTSGLRTPVGVKISGRDLKTIEHIGAQVQALLESVRGTRGIFAERTDSGYFIDINWRRDQLARYGISMAQAQQVIDNAIGGDNVTTVVSDVERYPVNVRYMRDFRNSVEALGRVLVPARGEGQIPISELAELDVVTGPSMIRNENGLPTGYVTVDLAGRDPGSYIEEARDLVTRRIALPAGYVIQWSGQYEAIERVNRRLRLIVPATLAIVILLIYCSTGSVSRTVIVLLAVPFSAIGAVWLLYLLHYNMSIAVWVGLIGLLSVDAETGVFMLFYLDLAYDEAAQMDRLRCEQERWDAIVSGAAKRLRPKFMTFATTCIGLMPVMWSIGSGSDVLKRIAAPMVGGIFTSFLLELLVYPVVYDLWRGHTSERTATRAQLELPESEENLAFSMEGD